MKISEILKDCGATDDNILEVLILWERKRKMEAARMLSSIVPKLGLSTLDSVGVIEKLNTELNLKP